ncbi:hypothetical protein HanXRQr2_Chr12g0541221 [Helianthus annuus]|uniref:Uncharacterized protein n=1 Tax=Helianthus annuus TaxID=4232 RepID=A0A9K3MVY9_HELAN|nr:hypothetical protein HanXRQr2_Chr12g0541221 [Helianthus annuus]KAJ0862671.1 hypothetical protein HanPSC8_Chr12g0520981 [Helianthus annuus]
MNERNSQKDLCSILDSMTKGNFSSSHLRLETTLIKYETGGCSWSSLECIPSLHETTR